MSFLILLLITFLLVALVLLLTSTHRRKVDSGIKTVESTSNHGVEILQTQIIRCKISHSRLFPVKHQFTYSYLSVGMPVRTPNSNWLLSIDVQNWWRRGWLHVTGNDHLHRLSHETTVLDKLNHYLRQQVIDPIPFNRSLDILISVSRLSIQRVLPLYISLPAPGSSVTCSVRPHFGTFTLQGID